MRDDYDSMLTLLHLTDLHGEFGNIDSFLGLGADMIAISGDLTDMGPADSIKDLLKKIDIPTFAVPGNCDPKKCIRVLEYSNAVCLHGSVMDIGPMTIAGIGGSNPTPFSTPFELSEEEIEKILSTISQRMNKNTHNVLLSHAPPKGARDLAGGEHVGSEAIAHHASEYNLILCGHIHEQQGIEKLGNTTIVNPGMASEGHAALIEFGREAGDISIELVTV